MRNCLRPASRAVKSPREGQKRTAKAGDLVLNFGDDRIGSPTVALLLRGWCSSRCCPWPSRSGDGSFVVPFGVKTSAGAGHRPIDERSRRGGVSASTQRRPEIGNNAASTTLRVCWSKRPGELFIFRFKFIDPNFLDLRTDFGSHWQWNRFLRNGLGKICQNRQNDLDEPLQVVYSSLRPSRYGAFTRSMADRVRCLFLWIFGGGRFPVSFGSSKNKEFHEN